MKTLPLSLVSKSGWVKFVKQVLLIISSILLLLLLNSCGRKQFSLSQLKSVSKLASLEVKLDKLLIADKEKILAGFLFGGIKLNQSSFIAHTEAKLLLGVDLQKISKKNIEVSPGRIYIKLPPIEVLDFSYPASSIWEDTTYISNSKFSIEEKEKLYQDAEKEIRATLRYLKLNEKAQAKIQNILYPMLSDIGFEEIELEFMPSEELGVNPPNVQ